MHLHYKNLDLFMFVLFFVNSKKYVFFNHSLVKQILTLCILTLLYVIYRLYIHLVICSILSYLSH